ncbi:UNVERIFIED_ORG: hypothetical protein J2X79_004044 [Arthrobacter globiformis]|nr:hypothetical protein [Arthrobacter globiformis]
MRDEPVGGPVGKLATSGQPVMTENGIRTVAAMTEQE